MTINRHNYEAFFLLYVDNELTVLEKKAVENFVIQNADLAQELEMLLQATLSDNTIQFIDKELLFKKEKGISLSNYEEYFLLSADNELNEQQKTEVENFVLKHPQLQNEFTLLQQTTLEPENIVFTAKKTLYRRQKEEWRISPAVWMRMSAAAIIFGVIITTLVLDNKNQINNNSTVITDSHKALKTTSEKDDNPLVQNPAIEKQAHSTIIKKDIKNNRKNTSLASIKTKVHPGKNKEIKSDKESFAVVKTKPDLKQKISSKSDSLPVAKTIINEPKNAAGKQIIIKPSIDNNNKADEIKNYPGNTPDVVMAKQTIAREQPVLASHAVYLETDNDEEEKTVLIGSAEINKGKLKGLFKKASGFFNKKIRRNDD